MSAGNLPRSDPPPEPPEDPKADRKPLTIRCLLFFDGTLNNKGNIDERVKDSAIYLKNRQNQDKEKRLANGAEGIDLEDDSYENDYSNIITLEANIATTQSDSDDTVIIYTEGAGTLKYIDPNDGTIGDNKDRLGAMPSPLVSRVLKPRWKTALTMRLRELARGQMENVTPKNLSSENSPSTSSASAAARPARATVCTGY